MTPEEEAQLRGMGAYVADQSILRAEELPPQPEPPRPVLSISEDQPVDYFEQERARQKKLEEDDQYFENYYTDEKFRNEKWRSKDGQFALSRTANPEELKQQSGNWAFLENKYGREIGFNEYPLVRRDYANREFGNPDLSESELFAKVQSEYELGKKRREAYRTLYGDTINNALLHIRAGEEIKGNIDIYERWKTANKDILQGRDGWATLQNSYNLQQNIKELVDNYGDDGARIWETLNAYREGKVGEIELRELATSLANIPKEVRDTKLWPMVATAARAEDGDLSKLQEFADNMAKSLGKGFSYLGATFSAVTGKKITPGDFELRSVPFGLGRIIIPTATPLSWMETTAQAAMQNAHGMPEGPEKEIATRTAREAMEMTNVVRELHDLAFNKIDPVEPLFPKDTHGQTLERGIYGIVGSLGWMAAAAASPQLAFLAIQQDEYNSIRSEFPEANPDLATAVSLFSAYPQAIIEKFQLDAMTVKLPFVSGYLRGIKSAILRGTLKTVASVGTQNIQELTQDAISEFTPGLIFALQKDAPNFDWQKHWEQYRDSRGEVVVAATMFGLIGAGAVDLGDLKDPTEILTDRHMNYLGIKPNGRDRVLRALRSEDNERLQRTVKEELDKRKPADIERGKKLAEADFETAARTQSNPNAPTMTSRVDKETGERLYTITRNESGELTPAGEQKVKDYETLLDCLGRGTE